MKYNVYCIPGLGGDERLFHFLNIENANIHHLHWFKPHPQESMISYAVRMSEHITETENLVLLGCSLGGVMALELARVVNPEKVILVSSLKSEEEKPFYFKLANTFPVYKWIGAKTLKKTTRIAKVFLGKMNESEFEVFDDMVQKTDDEMLTWGRESIVKWQAPKVLPPLLHIHGNKDRIFPKIPQNAKIIEGGDHVMIVTRADEVSAYINEFLNE